MFGSYQRHALEWDDDRQRFADRLRPASGVLDLGCGSGYPVARLMAERGMLVKGGQFIPADDRTLPDPAAVLEAPPHTEKARHHCNRSVA